MEEKGLPSCPLAQIAAATSERASAACRGAQVGSGTFHANIVLRGQAPYPTTGKLLLFNGKSHGKAALLGPAPKGFGGGPSFPLIRTSFGFDVGRELNSTLNRSCRARG